MGKFFNEQFMNAPKIPLGRKKIKDSMDSAREEFNRRSKIVVSPVEDKSVETHFTLAEPTLLEVQRARMAHARAVKKAKGAKA